MGPAGTPSCHEHTQPPTHSPANDLDDYAKGLVRRKARELVGKAGLTDSDRDDVAQQLAFKILQSLPAIDPDQGSRNAFIRKVVENLAANIVRDRLAEKRGHGKVVSLNVIGNAGGEAPEELAETVSQDEQDARRLRHPRSPEELAQLGADVAAVLDRLPDDLRALAVQLQSHCVTDAAHELGLPRTTAHSRIGRLRRVFEDAGLGAYLESRPSSRAATVY